jgi:hypothetical protein
MLTVSRPPGHPAHGRTRPAPAARPVPRACASPPVTAGRLAPSMCQLAHRLAASPDTTARLLPLENRIRPGRHRLA